MRLFSFPTHTFGMYNIGVVSAVIPCKRDLVYLWGLLTDHLHCISYSYLRRRRLCFWFGLFVCLSVYPSDNWKSCERILTKFLGRTGHVPGTNEFNFGDYSDHRPDPGVRSPKSGFTGLSIMLAFGGGLSSLSTSSLVLSRICPVAWLLMVHNVFLWNQTHFQQQGVSSCFVFGGQ